MGFMIVFITSSVLRGVALFLFPHSLFAAMPTTSVLPPESLIPATPQINGRPDFNSFANLTAPEHETSQDICEPDAAPPEHEGLPVRKAA
jgi:hypothetical protein